MGHMITKDVYDKYTKKLEDLVSNRNNTQDPMARLAITKKINRLKLFLENIEIKL